MTTRGSDSSIRLGVLALPLAGLLAQANFREPPSTQLIVGIIVIMRWLGGPRALAGSGAPG
jgi:hypothetical protein